MAIKQTIDQIIYGSYVLTMSDNMEVIKDGAVAIKGAKIVAVDTRETILQQYTAATILDKTGHVVMPGLINTHTHSPMIYLRGIADDLPLQEWLTQHIWPAEKKWLSPAFVYEGTKFACLEMINSGTTTFADMYFFSNELAKATKEMGMRAVIAPVIFDFPTNTGQTIDECFAITEEFIGNWLHDELVTPSIGPHAPYTCSTSTFQRAQKIAEKFNIPLIIHVAETVWEVSEILAKYGKRPVKYLDDIGCLTSRVVAVHCTHLDDEEIAILAKQGVGVAYCVESELKLASGFTPITKMLQTKIKLSFGTDGAASNNDLNLLSEISTAAKLNKALAKDATVLSAKTALFMATRGAAKVLNMEDKIGSLAPNFLADIITLDLQKIHLLPLYDIYSAVVYAAMASDVATVMVNGKLLMADGEMLHCDKLELMAKAVEWGKKINKL